MTGVRMSAGREAEIGRQFPVGVWVAEGRRRARASGREGETIVCGEEGSARSWARTTRAGLRLQLVTGVLPLVAREQLHPLLCPLETPQAPPSTHGQSQMVDQRRTRPGQQAHLGVSFSHCCLLQTRKEAFGEGERSEWRGGGSANAPDSIRLSSFKRAVPLLTLSLACSFPDPRNSYSQRTGRRAKNYDKRGEGVRTKKKGAARGRR